MNEVHGEEKLTDLDFLENKTSGRPDVMLPVDQIVTEKKKKRLNMSLFWRKFHRLTLASFDLIFPN